MAASSTRRAAWALAAFAAALAPLALAGPAPPPTLSDEALRARYALPASRFVTIDAIPLHVVDEGHGPAIVLLHGSFASLRQWDGWARGLSARYRVIRFDMPPNGLSGPLPNGDLPTDAQVKLIDDLTRSLGVDRFTLVATSSAGIPGAAYAAEHPERVKALILNNTAAGPLKPDLSNVSPEFKAALAADAKHPGWHAPEFWRQVILENVSNPAAATPAVVQQWTDLNNRTLHIAGPHPGLDPRTPGDLAKITAPTLVLWSADDKETTLEAHGKPTLALLASTDKALIVIPRCGHMMPIDCGDRALAAAEPFLERTAAR